jgi:hypothetical protein
VLLHIQLSHFFPQKFLPCLFSSSVHEIFRKSHFQLFISIIVF